MNSQNITPESKINQGIINHRSWHAIKKLTVNANRRRGRLAVGTSRLVSNLEVLAANTPGEGKYLINVDKPTYTLFLYRVTRAKVNLIKHYLTYTEEVQIIVKITQTNGIEDEMFSDVKQINATMNLKIILDSE